MNAWQNTDLECPATGPSVLRLAGETQPADAAALLRSATDLLDTATHVELHCEELRAIDFSCVQVLVALQNALSARGGTLQWVGAAPAIVESLVSAGFGSLLGLSVENGLQSA